MKSKLVRLFIKTFCITVLAVAAVFGAGWFILSQTPPDVETKQVAKRDNESVLPAFVKPEVDEEEVDALIIPEIVDMGDRKPSFYTFLVVGMDEGINTDTIMVAAYDGVAKQAYVIGIPRDSKVNVSFRPPKINAAYMVGTYNGGGMEGGIERLRSEVYKIMGFVPDYYIIIDLNAFVRIVDAVNGVEVDVPFDMKYDDRYQNLNINIPKGLQTLYGEDALKFARYRLGNDRSKSITDYKRIENQQAVIQAVLKKLLKLSSIPLIPEFVSIFNENVHTDIKLHQMPWFIDQLNELRGNDNVLEAYTIPTIGTSGPPNYYELLDKPAIVELVNRTVNPYKRDITPEDLDIAG